MLFCLLLGLCFPLGAAFPPCGPDGGCENGQMEDMNLLSLHKGNVVKVNKSGDERPEVIDETDPQVKEKLEAMVEELKDRNLRAVPNEPGYGLAEIVYSMDYVLLQLAKLQLRVADLEAREASFRRCFQLRRGREADRCLRAMALQTQATASSNSKVSEEVKDGAAFAQESEIHEAGSRTDRLATVLAKHGEELDLYRGAMRRVCDTTLPSLKITNSGIEIVFGKAECSVPVPGFPVAGSFGFDFGAVSKEWPAQISTILSCNGGGNSLWSCIADEASGFIAEKPPFNWVSQTAKKVLDVVGAASDLLVKGLFSCNDEGSGASLFQQMTQASKTQSKADGLVTHYEDERLKLETLVQDMPEDVAAALESMASAKRRMSLFQSRAARTGKGSKKSKRDDDVKAGPAGGGLTTEDGPFTQTGLVTQFNGVEMETGSCLAYAPEAFSGNASGLTPTEMSASLWAAPDGKFLPLKPYAVPCGNAHLNLAYCKGKDCSPENRAFRNWEGFAMYTSSTALEKCYKFSFSLGMPEVVIPPFSLATKLAKVTVTLTLCKETGTSPHAQDFSQSITTFGITISRGKTDLIAFKSRLRGFPFKTGPWAKSVETFSSITSALPLVGNLRSGTLPEASTLEFGASQEPKQNQTRNLKPRYGTSLLMRQARSRQDDPNVEVLSELHDSAVLAHHRKSAKARLEGRDSGTELFDFDSTNTFPEALNKLANFGISAIWDNCELFLRVRLQLFEKINVEPENDIKVFDLQAVFNKLLDQLVCDGEVAEAGLDTIKNLLSDQCGGGDPTKPETYGVGVSTEILHLRQLARNTAWNSVAPNLGQWKDVSSEGNDLALNGQDTTIDVVGVDCCSPNFVRCGLFGRSSTGQTEYQSTSFRPNLLSGKEAFFVASFASVKARQFIFDFGQYATFGFGVLFKNQDIEAYGPGDVKAQSTGGLLEAGRDYFFRVQWVPGLHIRIILNNMEEIAKVPFPDNFVEEDISDNYFTVLGQSKEASKSDRRLNGRLYELVLFEGIMEEEDAKEYGDLLMKKWFFDPAQRELSCASRCQFGN